MSIKTEDQKQVVVSLKKNDKSIDSLSEENEYGSQVLLPLIEKILKKNKIGYKQSLKTSSKDSIFKDLKGIEVETGPGSFTGLRVGVSVANALGYSLGIPVNGKKLETDLKY